MGCSRVKRGEEVDLPIWLGLLPVGVSGGVFMRVRDDALKYASTHSTRTPIRASTHPPTHSACLKVHKHREARPPELPVDKRVIRPPERMGWCGRVGEVGGWVGGWVSGLVGWVSGPAGGWASGLGGWTGGRVSGFLGGRAVEQAAAVQPGGDRRTTRARQARAQGGARTGSPPPQTRSPSWPACCPPPPG